MDTDTGKPDPECLYPPEESSFGWGIHGQYVHDINAAELALRIDRADPWSVLSAAEINFLHEHPQAHSPAIVLRCGPGCPEGDVLTLSGVNRRVIYRLTEPLKDTGGWIMKWPD